ncbi:MAG: zinc ribbon domain-containing protein [Chloroflexi bacterium]|nr:zinc ribbon domain-containing protein [Chloroflexota bacterium]
MPLYEYECENCAQRFERFQSIQDAPVRQCPECAGPVHKVFHPAGIIFKGSGWYITDSRKSTSGTVTSDAKSNGGEAKTETKTEPKSNGGEPKTETAPSPSAAKPETSAATT